MPTVAASQTVIKRNIVQRIRSSKSPSLVFVGLILAASGSLAFAQTPKIKITDPQVKAGTVLLAQGAVDITITVNDEELKMVRVMVTSDIGTYSEDEDIDTTEPNTVSVDLFKGSNRIKIIGIKDGAPDPKIAASITVTCSGNKCKGAATAKKEEEEEGDDPKPPKPAKGDKVPPKGDKAKPEALKISAVDEVPVDTEETPVSFTKDSNATITYIRLLDPNSDTAKRINFGAKNTVATNIKLKTGTNVVTAFGFDAADKKIAEATKTILANITAKTEAVTLSNPFKVNDITEFPLSVNVKDQGNLVTKLAYRITNAANVEVDKGQQGIPTGDGIRQIPIRIGPGVNNVYVEALKADDTAIAAGRTTIECSGACGGPSTKVPRILLEPKPNAGAARQSDYPVLVTPTDPNATISKYIVEVRNKETRSVFTDEVAAIRGADNKSAPQIIVMRMRSGKNTVVVFGRDNDGKQVTEDATTVVDCFECTDAPSTALGSSLHARSIIGLEQAGGSGSNSEQKAFLDLFFSAPLGLNDHEGQSRLATWGSIRLASVPTQQLATGGNLALQGFAGNFLTNFQNVQVNQLVHGFDFLAGIEHRLFGGGSRYLSTVPGTWQKTSVSLIAAFGAINPFETEPAAQIFVTPKIGGHVDPEFIKLFPDAAGKSNIAFVTPERDRFFRQYYGGFRFKTHFYDKHGLVINRFPSILDVTVGHNEVVTGLLREPVLRLEGFYPFPFKAAKFLYLYGTAMMKVGGKRKPQLPLNLDPAVGASLTDPSTLVVPIDTNPNLRSTRDYYRIGVGINLIELLDKLRTPAP